MPTRDPGGESDRDHPRSRNPLGIPSAEASRSGWMYAANRTTSYLVPHWRAPPSPPTAGRLTNLAVVDCSRYGCLLDLCGLLLVGRTSIMPTAFPRGFRRGVVAVACNGVASISQVSKDFGISEWCLPRCQIFAAARGIHDGPLRSKAAMTALRHGS